MGAPRPDADPLLERLLPMVGAWCARLCPPGMDSDAVALDVVLVLLRRRHELRPDVPVEPWAFAVTRMQVRNHRQRAWFRRWLPGEVRSVAPDTPASLLEDAQCARQVHTVLDALSEAHREVLVLCDVEERSRAEVAAILGLPEGTVKSRLRLAREAFRAEALRRRLPFAPRPQEDDRA